ncbi:Uncharacterised protein [uncultured archaeon]|nr:Uncharacterised protein [uncultured archaeon]
MRRKSINYEKYAMPAFIIVFALSLVLFYLIYTGKIGMSVAGTRSLACIEAGLSSEECAALKVVQSKVEYCCCEKQTQQRGGRMSSSPVSFTISGSRIGNEDYAEEVQTYCPTFNNECVCQYYCENVQPQSEITTTYFVGVGKTAYEACKGKSYERDISQAV